MVESVTSTGANLTSQPSLVDALTNALRAQSCANSHAEAATGLAYTYSFTFNNGQVKQAADTMLVHCMRMLCVLAAVVDESALPSALTTNLNAGSTAVSAPPPPPPSMSSQGSASNLGNSTNSSSSANTQTSLAPPASNTNETLSSPSFLRSKLNNITDLRQSKSNVSSVPGKANPTSATSSTTGGESTADTTSLPKTTTNVYLGYFQASSHYLKLYETSKLLFNIYKKSPQLGTYDRFLSLVKETLHMFAQLLEAALSVHEVGPHLDEILLYLRILFAIEPSCTVKCVTLCLKALFGLNLAGLMFENVQQQLVKLSSSSASTSGLALGSSSVQSGLSLSNANSNINLVPTPLSNFSSVLSTSLQSISSVNQTPTTPLGHQLASSWSFNSQRNQNSLHATVISNHLSQFTRFMYAQTIMHKNDTGGLLGSSGVQFNPNLVNLGTIGLDSIEYMNTSTVSMATVTSGVAPTNTTSNTYLTGSMSSISSIQSKQSSSSSVATTSTASSKALVKSSPFGSGFSLFGFIRKANNVKAEETAASEQIQMQKVNQQMQQQQAIQELQQQKLKQQKTDMKIIGQYIKSFESIVIKSLKQYTVTTSVNLQTRILELLNTLIFLKVFFLVFF